MLRALAASPIGLKIQAPRLNRNLKTRKHSMSWSDGSSFSSDVTGDENVLLFVRWADGASPCGRTANLMNGFQMNGRVVDPQKQSIIVELLLMKKTQARLQQRVVSGVSFSVHLLDVHRLIFQLLRINTYSNLNIAQHPLSSMRSEKFCDFFLFYPVNASALFPAKHNREVRWLAYLPVRYPRQTSDIQSSTHKHIHIPIIVLYILE